MQRLRLIRADGPDSIPLTLQPSSLMLRCRASSSFYLDFPPRFHSRPHCGHCCPSQWSEPVASLPVARRRSTSRGKRNETIVLLLILRQVVIYDLIDYCPNCELTELEKSLLLLDVFLVDWLLLVFTGSIKLSFWCSEPKNFLAHPARLFVKGFKESCVVWRLVETRTEAPADAWHRIINCNRKAIVRLIHSSIVFQEHWKQFDNFREVYGWLCRCMTINVQCSMLLT